MSRILCKFYLGFLHLIILFSKCHADVVFNYEIGARVEDKISGFTEIVEKALSVSYYTMISGNLRNASDPFGSCRTLFFSCMNIYSEIYSVYAGYENGQFYGYGVLSGHPPVNLGVTKNAPVGPGGTFLNFRYEVHSDGSPGAYIKNWTYAVRQRGWYKTAKSTRINFWTSPYIDASSGSPVISLIYPILNYTKDGHYYNFAGALGADIFFTKISLFLKEAYASTDRSVFLVDKGTGSLIGTSLDAKTYSLDSKNNKNLMPALNSENSLIAGATATLSDKGWPTTLVIYEDYYLQSTEYSDSITGLTWYVVVLLPAVLEYAYLGPESSMYYVVIAFAVISLLVGLICLAITFYYWKSKMMKLTQPFFTVTVLIGGVLLSILCFLLLGENTESLCGVRPFLFNLSFTIAFSPLLIKSWRVHVLFNLNPLAKNKIIGNRTLFFYTMIFVFVDAIILVLTLYAGSDGTSPKTLTILGTNGAYAQLTYCGYRSNSYLSSTEIAYKGALITAACYLSFRTRNIAGAISGSKIVFAVVYNTAFTCGVILLIIHSVTTQRVIVVCEAVGICFCVIMTALMFTVPIVYQILVVGDAAAMEEVMEEVFDKKSKSSKAVGGGGRMSAISGNYAVSVAPEIKSTASGIVVESKEKYDGARAKGDLEIESFREQPTKSSNNRTT